MERNKYSITANSDVIKFLVNNGINFVCRKGVQSQRRRVFFIASPEQAETLTEMTGWHVSDENDGWDFDGWSAIEL